MKNRIISFLFAIALFNCIFPVFASAQSLLLTDLSDFGISAMCLDRNSTPVCDGKILENEYQNGSVFTSESGLYLFNREACMKINQGSNIRQESFVSLSDGMVCCALRMSLPLADISLSPTDQSGVPSYKISFSLGLSSGNHPALRGSLLTNTYYFSAENFNCVGFTGERIARSIQDKSVVAKPLSSFSKAYRENGIVTSDGVCWNAEQYCKNAYFSLLRDSSQISVISEVQIPLEDVLLSVHPSERDDVYAALKDPSANLCGGFSTQLQLDDSSCLVAGVPSKITIPNGSETLFAWMKNNFQMPASGLFIPEVLPIPLYWTGTPPVRVDATDENQTVSSETLTNIVADTSKPSAPASVPSASVVVSEEAEVILKNDESIFDSLPDKESNIPEETEILYDEETSTEEPEEEHSLLSSVLAMITGILLFAIVIFLCFYFRESEKKRREEEKKKNKRKKKSDQK